MNSSNPTSPTAFERWELPNVGPRVPTGQRVPSGPLTAAQVEAVQSQAYDEAARDGHAEGFAKGLEDGKQAGQVQAQAYCERLATIADCLAEPLKLVDEELQQTLLTLAVTIAKQIVRRELKTDPGQVLAGIREVVAALGSVDRQVKLFLHRDDIELIKGLGALDADALGWQLIEDSTVTAGGCRVTSGASYIDATIEQRMASVVATAIGGDRSPNRASDIG